MIKIIPTGSYGDTFEGTIHGIVPSRVVIGIVLTETYLEILVENPLKSEYFGVESIGFYVNGEPTPKQPFWMNVLENICLGALLHLSRDRGKLWEDTDRGITREIYKEKVTLVAFDVDPTSDSDLGYLSFSRFGHTCQNIKLKRT